MKLQSMPSWMSLLALSALLSACGDDNVSGPQKGTSFTSLQSIFVEDCGSCHGALSGRLFTVGMDSTDLQESGLVDPADPEQSLLLAKPTNVSAHGGGTIASFNAEEQARVRDWIAHLPPASPKLLEAVKVGAGTTLQAPVVDGFFDAVWDRAASVELVLADGWGDAQSVKLKAAYDADYLYMLVTWDDDKASIRRQPWVKQANGTWKSLDAKTPLPTDGTTWAQYMGSSFNEEDPARFNYEDKLSIMWNTYGSTTVAGFEKNGCGVTCHDPARGNGPGSGYYYGRQESAAKMYTNAPSEIADLWHWKLVRNNQHFKADDQYVRYWVPGPTGASEGGRASDAGAAGYGNNPSVSGQPQYRGPTTSVPPYYILDNQKVALTATELSGFAAGTEIPNMITTGPTGTRADVDARGLFNTGRWILEIRRKLVTGDVNDVQFDNMTRQYAFGVAIFDNAQIEHRYTPMVARLLFKP